MRLIFKTLVLWGSYFYACPSWLSEASKLTLNMHEIMLCLPPDTTQSPFYCVPRHPYHLARSLVSLKAQVAMPAKTPQVMNSAEALQNRTTSEVFLQPGKGFVISDHVHQM